MTDALYRDIRFGLRRLLKDPLFTLSVVVPIALGVGVNTAMFTVGDALLRKPLAISDIGRLAAIVQTRPEDKSATSSVTPADYLDLERQNRSFERIAAYQYENRVLTRGDSPVSIVAAAVSPEFFRLFSASARMGHTFDASVNDNANSLVVSYSFWRDRLGAELTVGRTIELDSQSYKVVGVMPKGFNFPVGTEIWLPLAFGAKAANDRTSHEIRVVGKLRPGVTMTNSNAELETIANRLATDSPDTNKGWGIRAIPLSELITGRMTGQYVMFLLGGVLFVLVMACSNVANLLLARGTTRQSEMAIQEALGASRARLISQLLTESTLIAVIGAALSLPLASLALHLIRGNMPAQTVKFIPGFESIEMDHTVLLLTLIMAVLSGAFAGVTPAVRVTRCDVNEVLKAGGRSGTASRANTRLRSVLLMGEIALAMALLVGTGLIVKSVHSLSSVNPGSAPVDVLTMRISLPVSRYSDAASCERFHSRLLDALQSFPQLDSVAIGSDIPYGGHGTFLPFTTEGSSPVRTGNIPSVRTVSISRSYLGSLRIRLRVGRNFNSSDRPEAPLVAIVSQGLASQFWPNQIALGKRFRLGSLPEGRWITIIGIAAEVSFNWLDEPSSPVLYLPLSQSPSRADFVILRTSKPRQLITAARARIRSIDPTQPVLDAKTWDAVITESMIGLSYVAVIMTVLGAIALVLASFGLFGLMSYNVRSQRKELGVRIALGATAPVILRMVLRHAFLLTGCGIAIGMSAALVMSRMISHLMFGFSSLDLTVYLLPATALLIAGLTSAYFPALKASRTEAIRGDAF
jgi:putative ABC transport system permease protein